MSQIDKIRWQKSVDAPTVADECTGNPLVLKMKMYRLWKEGVNQDE